MLYLAASLLDKSSSRLPHTGADDSNLNNILSVVFVIIGALAVLMIVIGGLRYILAQGEPNQVTQAKNTIIYAIIGLVLAALAYSIVNFVLNFS